MDLKSFYKEIEAHPNHIDYSTAYAFAEALLPVPDGITKERDVQQFLQEAIEPAILEYDTMIGLMREQDSTSHMYDLVAARAEMIAEDDFEMMRYRLLAGIIEAREDPSVIQEISRKNGLNEVETAFAVEQLEYAALHHMISPPCQLHYFVEQGKTLVFEVADPTQYVDLIDPTLQKLNPN